MGGDNSAHDEREERVLSEILFQRMGGENHIWKKKRELYTRGKERILREMGEESSTRDANR
jgi:hypothetical protein